MLVSSIIVLASAGSLAMASPTPKAATLEARQSSRATIAIETMQKEWYNERTGLWETTGWWQSANSLTAVGDFALAGLKSNVNTRDIFENTFSKAQTNGARVVKERSLDPHGLPRSFYSSTPPPDSVARRSLAGHSNAEELVSASKKGFAGFINEYYDDEGWWALALLRAHDLGYGPQYIEMANSIFEDMHMGTSPCGGIFWSKTSAYTNAIANELYLAVAASLANRMPSSLKKYYLDIAKAQWEWFKNSGMINEKHLINDGLHDWNSGDSSACKNNGGATWSYNQGVILGALVELAKASGDDSFIDSHAKPIARAAMSTLSSNGDGILNDPCDPSNNCGGDGAQFKGIFMRNLKYLQKAYPEQDIGDYIKRQSDAIWNNARDGDKFGLVWKGPYQKADAISEGIALDAFIGAESI